MYFTLIQILRVDHDQLASQYIQCKIEEYKEYVRCTKGEDDDDDDDSNDKVPDGPPEEDLHVKVGSCRPPKSFEAVKAENSENIAFEQLRIKINNFFNYSPVGRVLLDHQGLRNVQLNAKDEVSAYINRIVFVDITNVMLCTVTGYRVSVSQSQLRIYG